MATYQALIVTLLAVLPGASYIFAFERTFGSYGVSLADRLIRFFAASAAFWALFSGLTYLAFDRYFRDGKFGEGSLNPWVVEGLALAYVIVPTAFGVLVGRAKQEGKRWATIFAGESIEPRAWDFVWRPRRNALVRLKLKSGVWVAGLFTTDSEGIQSYASGYPESGDLFLSRTIAIDPESGVYALDREGQVTDTAGGGLLLKWDEVEYMEIQHY